MIDGRALEALERTVGEALATGRTDLLAVLGRGEVSVVLGWPAEQPAWACKRLPPFADGGAADRYAATLARYLAELAARGVAVIDTEVMPVAIDGGRVVLYCVQPALSDAELAVPLIRNDPDRARPIMAEIVETAISVVDAAVGLDGQLSNWAVVDGRLTYLDITTPMLRRADGSSELDTKVFLASLPWALRAVAHRMVIPGVLDRYHKPRTVVLDLAANLLKERLDRHIPLVLELSADRLTPPLTEAEVRRDYRSDARMWSLMQSVRRADRWWQRRVRRRQYGFLLPEGIER